MKIIGAFLMFMIVFPTSQTPPQAPRRVIVVPQGNSPVQITMKVDGKALALVDRPLADIGLLPIVNFRFPTVGFDAADDWTDQLTLVVKNVSTRSISYLSFDISRPVEGDLNKREAIQTWIWGGGGDKALVANEEVQISAKHSIAGWQGAQLLLIELGTVFFDSDRSYMWRHGKILKQDAKDPSRYVVVEPERHHANLSPFRSTLHLPQVTQFCTDKFFVHKPLTAQPEINCIDTVL